MLNPLHLATLEVVLRQGSFVAAAHSMGYTASAVSQQMSSLERSTGLVLFERLPRSVRPTPAARYLADGSSQILSGLRSLQNDAQALAAAKLGEIRLGCFRTASARMLPDVLNTFRGNHPAVSVQLDEAEPDDLIPGLLDGDLDIAVVYENELAHQEWPNNLVRVPLLTEKRFLLLPPRLRRMGESVRLSSLRYETWIASKPSPSLLRLCARAGFEPNVALRTNDYYSICEFVRAGLGIALVPELGYFLPESLEPREVSPRAPTRDVFALYRRSNLNPLLTSMLDTMTSAAGSLLARLRASA